jgi:hypothetical protein
LLIFPWQSFRRFLQNQKRFFKYLLCKIFTTFLRNVIDGCFHWWGIQPKFLKVQIFHHFPTTYMSYICTLKEQLLLEKGWRVMNYYEVHWRRGLVVSSPLTELWVVSSNPGYVCIGWQLLNRKNLRRASAEIRRFWRRGIDSFEFMFEFPTMKHKKTSSSDL